VKSFLKAAPLILLFVLIVIIYFPALNGEFIFDDDVYIVHNPGIRNIFDLPAIGVTAAQPLPSRYVALFTFALNYHFHKLDPFPYHVTNVLIHAITAFFVFMFIRALLNAPKITGRFSENNKLIISFSSAFIFAAHPLQTQAVSYLSQRCVSLATMFYLISVWFYLKARLSKGMRLRVLLISGCFLSGLLGMFTKEIVITLPLMIILIEFLFFKNKQGLKFTDSVRRNWWVFPVLSGVLIIPVLFNFSIENAINIKQNSQSHEGDVITLGKYIITEVRVAAEYLRLFFLPVRQNFDYDFPLVSLFSIQWAVSITVLGALFIYAWRSIVKRRLAAFGIFWFFITLLPEFIPRANVIFEHKLYLLSIGLSLSVAAILTEAVRDKKWMMTALFFIIIIESGLTFSRNNVWKDPLSLWLDVVKKSPVKSRPLNSLGLMYFNRGEDDQALEYFNKAIAANGANVEALNNRGVIYRKRGDYQKALRDFSLALHYRPAYAEALNNRGVIYKQLGKDKEALDDFIAASKINPTYSELHFNIGLIYENRGDLGEAEKRFANAVIMNENNFDARNHLGIVLARTGRIDKAVVEFEKALKIKPDSPEILNNLGSIMFMKGDIQNAIEYYTKAISVKNDYIDAYKNRAVSYKSAGMILESIDDYSYLIRLAPKNGSFYLERAILYSFKGEKVKAEADLMEAGKLGMKPPQNVINALK
jgi:tetratricopeptide (TPR) repeat protein